MGGRAKGTPRKELIPLAETPVYLPCVSVTTGAPPGAGAARTALRETSDATAKNFILFSCVEERRFSKVNSRRPRSSPRIPRTTLKILNRRTCGRLVPSRKRVSNKLSHKILVPLSRRDDRRSAASGRNSTRSAGDHPTDRRAAAANPQPDSPVVSST